MIIHIALFKWKTNIQNDEIEEILKKVKQLKNKCKGIQDIFCGKNYHKESNGFTHGIVIIAENQESLDEYRQHPDHKKIAEFIEQIEEKSLGFDFKDQS